MAIPEYQTFMAPVLRALQDGQPHLHKEIREVVAREMGITEAERQQLIKSGVPVFDSRVGWAVTYMVRAGLVRRPRRGVNQITEAASRCSLLTRNEWTTTYLISSRSSGSFGPARDPHRARLRPLPHLNCMQQRLRRPTALSPARERHARRSRLPSRRTTRRH